MGGFGLYLDIASGIYVYINIAHNNLIAGLKLAGSWQDGDVVYYNNTTANSLYGFHFGGKANVTHGGRGNTQLFNNILVNHESYGIFLSDTDGVFENTTIPGLWYSI